MPPEPDHDADDHVFSATDEKEARDAINRGVKALLKLKGTAGDNWSTGWSIVVRGWGGLRELAFKGTGSRDMQSHSYRSAMNLLLSSSGNREYADIPKETRSSMSKLVDHIDEIDTWYSTISIWDRERWTHPSTIAKHCPKHFLSSYGVNQPPQRRKAKGPKKKGNPEAESLRAILIKVIKRLAKYEPDALDLLDDLYQSDPDDAVGDLGIDDDVEESDDDGNE